jgi:hypothetical protein
VKNRLYIGTGIVSALVIGGIVLLLGTSLFSSSSERVEKKTPQGKQATITDVTVTFGSSAVKLFPQTIQCGPRVATESPVCSIVGETSLKNCISKRVKESGYQRATLRGTYRGHKIRIIADDTDQQCQSAFRAIAKIATTNVGVVTKAVTTVHEPKPPVAPLPMPNPNPDKPLKVKEQTETKRITEYAIPQCANTKNLDKITEACFTQSPGAAKKTDPSNKATPKLDPVENP